MAELPARSPRVLLVEDEFLVSDMISSVLAERGFEVHAVASATEALRHLLGGAPCDLLFTDINLPGGMDGAVLARRARELRPDLPVVYASGAVRGLGPGEAVPGSMFVGKPYSTTKLCALLARMVEKRI